MPDWTRLTLDTRDALQRAVTALRQAGFSDQQMASELTRAALVDLDLLREVVGAR